MCRVWFYLVGAKNTTGSTWDAPETAFKIMVASTPNKLHSQAVEYCKMRKDSVEYRTSAAMSKRRSGDLDTKADSILAKLFKDGYVREHTSTHTHESRWLLYNTPSRVAYSAFKAMSYNR
jgi:hypothetical protein